MASRCPQDVFSDETEPFVLRNLLCDPCSVDGHHFIAEGYCVDCSDFLCITCYQHHRRPKPCRDHKLLDKRRMPKRKLLVTSDNECKETCVKHEQIFSFFCKTHEIIGCEKCKTSEHKTCEKEYLLKPFKTWFKNNDYKTFLASIEFLEKQFNTIQAEAMRNIKEVKAIEIKTQQAIHPFCMEIRTYFNKLEKEMSDKISRVSAEKTNKLSELSKECESFSQTLSNLYDDVKSQENRNQYYMSFRSCKVHSKNLLRFADRLKDIEAQINVTPIEFIPFGSFSNLFLDKLNLGVCLKSYEKCYIEIPDIRALKIIVAGLTTLSNGCLALIDHANDVLILYDTHKKIITKTKCMQKYVKGINALSGDEIVVKQKSNIEIYHVTNEIKLKKEIEKTELADGPFVCKDNTIIGFSSFAPPILLILNMDGDVVKKINVTGKWVDLFEKPWYIAVNRENTAIYVSDCDMRTLTRLTFEGEVSAQYKNDGLWNPHGVAVSSDGIVYVCDWRNHAIHILSPDLLELGIIRGQKYGIMYPRVLAYCEKEHKLYVGMLGESSLVALSL